MEKLIELLSEYTNKHPLCIRMSEPYKGVYLQYDENFTVDIISKQFGFIKRIVQNDKIDRDKILKENGLFRKYFYDLEYVKNYDRLVMWLSVEDEPIDLLCKLLK